MLRRLLVVVCAMLLALVPAFAELVCVEIIACGIAEDKGVLPVAFSIESALMNPWFNAGHIASNDAMQSKPGDYSLSSEFPLPVDYRIKESGELDADILVVALLQFPVVKDSAQKPLWIWIQIRNTRTGALLAERKMAFEARLSSDKDFYVETESMMQDVMQGIRGR